MVSWVVKSVSVGSRRWMVSANLKTPVTELRNNGYQPCVGGVETAYLLVRRKLAPWLYCLEQ